MRKIVATILVMLGVLPALALAQGDPWNDVQGVPPGTRLRIVLRNGSEVTGTVVSTTPDSVVMADNVPGATGLTMPGNQISLKDPLTFPRADVVSAVVTATAKRYVATGSTDANAVRRLITSLGTGKKIAVKTRQGVSLRGTIQAIGENDVRLGGENPGGVERVVYGDVTELKAVGMGTGAKAAMIVGIVGGGLAVLLFYNCAHDPNGICS